MGSFKLRIEKSFGLEIWKSIEGYEGLYKVSTLGNVKSLNYNKTGKEQILKTVNDKGGYQLVSLCKDGKPKSQLVHGLVSKAWLPTPQKGETDINHKNEDKTDNRVENLEWCTRSYNINYGTRNKRISKANLNHPDKSKAVLQFDKSGRLIAEFPSLMEAERQTGINQGNIYKCCNEKRQSAGGYVWTYK